MTWEPEPADAWRECPEWPEECAPVEYWMYASVPAGTEL